jgi:hypothetical protein
VLCGTRVGEVDKRIHGAEQRTLTVANWSGVYEKLLPRSVWSFDDYLNVVERAIVLQAHGHLAFIVRQRAAVGPIKAPSRTIA